MPAIKTPAVPVARFSFEQLKKQARDLQKGHRDGSPESAQRLRRLPKFKSLPDDRIFTQSCKLSDAQYVIALEQGAASWPDLRRQVRQSCAVTGEGLPDPVAWWPLNEGRGCKAKEAMGTGHDGIIKNAEYTYGIKTHGLWFRKRLSHVAVEPGARLRPRKELTFSFWVREIPFQDTINPDGNHLHGFPIFLLNGSYRRTEWKDASPRGAIDRIASGVGGFMACNHYQSISVMLRLNKGHSHLSVARKRPNEELNIWRHYAATFSGKRLALFLDGNLVDEAFCKPSEIFYEGSQCAFGTPHTGNPWNMWYCGAMNDVRLWDCALSDIQVARLYCDTPTAFMPWFTSSPPESARRGKMWHYEIQTGMQNSEPIKLELEKGPKGMVLQGAKLSWKPGRTASQQSEVVLAARTPSGRTMKQAFSVSLVTISKAFGKTPKTIEQKVRSATKISDLLVPIRTIRLENSMELPLHKINSVELHRGTWLVTGNHLTTNLCGDIGSQDRVFCFDGGGKLIRAFGRSGAGADQLGWGSRIRKILPYKDHVTLLCDGWPSRIVNYSLDGTFLSKHLLPGYGHELYRHPRTGRFCYIVGSSLQIHMRRPDFAIGRPYMMLDECAQVQFSFGRFPAKKIPINYFRLDSGCFDSRGNFWTIDYFKSEISIFDSQGRCIRTIDPGQGSGRYLREEHIKNWRKDPRRALPQDGENPTKHWDWWKKKSGGKYHCHGIASVRGTFFLMLFSLKRSKATHYVAIARDATILNNCIRIDPIYRALKTSGDCIYRTEVDDSASAERPALLLHTYDMAV